MIPEGLANLLREYREYGEKAVLPRPDRYGNYWLTNDPLGPAIFHTCKIKGKFIASLGNDMLWEGKGFRYFNTPGEAYVALLRHGVNGC